jgi:hypothetical protein
MIRQLALICAFITPFAGLAAQTTWVATTIVDVPGVAASGEVNFEYPVGATRLQNGFLLIADKGPSSVRLIDSKGKLVKTISRKGPGPGEFRSMLAAVGCGRDSLLVWDYSARLATIVTASGVARRFSIPSVAGPRPPLLDIACTTDGRIGYVSEPTGRVQSALPGVFGTTASVVITARDGKVITQFDELPGSQFVSTVSPRGGQGAFPRPLSASTLLTGMGDRLLFGSSDSSQVTVLAPDGSRSYIAIPTAARRAPTDAEFEAAAAAIAALAPKAMVQSAQDQLTKSPRPERLPAYTALHGTNDGRLWVQTSPQGATSLDLLACDMEGHVVGKLHIPLALTIYEIAGGHIVGAYSDASDEVHVVDLKISRRETRSRSADDRAVRERIRVVLSQWIGS